MAGSKTARQAAALGALLCACGSDAPVELESVRAPKASGLWDGRGSGAFAQGTQPLTVQAAPDGLCAGHGAKKDCDQAGCESDSWSAEPPIGTAGYGGPSGLSASRAPLARTRLQAVSPGFCDGIEPSEPARLYLSADDSGSMASPVIVRDLIRRGVDVDPRVVRPWEFLSYYDLSFEPAVAGGVRLVPQISSCPQDGLLSFQVALSSERRSTRARAPLNLTFVLDTSGSMATSVNPEATPMELERAAVRAVASGLRRGDVVSMVTWSTIQQEMLAGLVVEGPNDRKLLAAADSLAPNGGTDLSAGLRRGYELAREHHAPDRINRILLVSDGMANVGVTDEELIGRYADAASDDPEVYLAGVLVGTDVNEELMQTVTDLGRGAYLYLDSVEEAHRMLGDRLLQVLDVAARDVRLEMTLPWYLNVRKFYGEVLSKRAADVRPQHLAPNDAMVFFQVLEACDPRMIHGDDRVLLRATWRAPGTRAPREETLFTTLNELAGDDRALLKASAIVAYAEAIRLAGAAESLEARRVHLVRALGAVTQARFTADDADLAEIEDLLRLAIGRRVAYPVLPSDRP